MKEFRLVMKLRNNLLTQRREELGLTTKEVAEGAGISYGQYMGYEALKCRPMNKKGEWLPTAVKVANFYRALPEDLWPDVVRQVERNTVERCIDGPMVRALISTHTKRMSLPPSEFTEQSELRQDLLKAMHHLNPRQQKVLALRFWEGHTLGEVANMLDLTQERIRQIELKALSILRHSRHTAHLRSWRSSDSVDAKKRTIRLKVEERLRYLERIGECERPRSRGPSPEALKRSARWEGLRRGRAFLIREVRYDATHTGLWAPHLRDPNPEEEGRHLGIEWRNRDDWRWEEMGIPEMLRYARERFDVGIGDEVWGRDRSLYRVGGISWESKDKRPQLWGIRIGDYRRVQIPHPWQHRRKGKGN